MTMHPLQIALVTMLFVVSGCTANVISTPPDAGVETDAETPPADSGNAEVTDADTEPAPDAGAPPPDASEPPPDSTTPSCVEETREWLVESTTCSAFGVQPLSAVTTIVLRGSQCNIDIVGTADCGNGSSDASNRSTQTWLEDRSGAAVMLDWCGGDFRTLSCTVQLDPLDRLVLSCSGSQTCSITLVEDTRS